MAIEGGTTLVWGIVGLGFSIGVGLMILSGFKGGMVDNTAEYNATDTVITSLSTAPTWVSIIVVVAFAGLVYGFVQIFK